jgi:hypothetical protein
LSKNWTKKASLKVHSPDPNALVDHVPMDIPDVAQNISSSLLMNVESTASLEGDGSSICVQNV